MIESQSPSAGNEPDVSSPEDGLAPKNNGPMFVAVGASAGGVEALQRLFAAMPKESGLIFAVMLHTASEHHSHLPEIIQRKTQIPVVLVNESAHLEANHIYCLRSDREIELSNDAVVVTDRSLDGHRNVPIDLLLRTTANVYKQRAVSVILTGSGADGSLGTARVHEEGGVNIAQDPVEAEYPSMPRSAIERGAVDFILPLEQIPPKLISLRQNAERISMPPAKPQDPASSSTLVEILGLLRARTRHDFANYKRGTVLRRIERRLQITECEDLPTYLRYIHKHPEELRSLLRDMLISVTNFFRDPEAFKYLESEVVPRLVANCKSTDQLRVWVPGCATGEEAYSLAMIFSEQAEAALHPPAIQIFATDIDEEALIQARNGLYPGAIVMDVFGERLRRHFTRDGLCYRVKRELREMILFAPQNLLRDSPFSKLDLISCRNLLIYINRPTQNNVLEIFQFALKPGGYLFLGSSESAEGFSSTFTTVNKKFRVFQREGSETGVRSRTYPATDIPSFEPLPPISGSGRLKDVLRGAPTSWSELHYRALEALGPPSVLINADAEIVHSSERAGRFLRVTGGQPSHNLLRSILPSMQFEVRALMTEALKEGEARRTIAAEFEHQQCLVEVTVRALTKPWQGYMLVTFQEVVTDKSATAEANPGHESDAADRATLVADFEEQIRRAREDLRRSLEEQETSTEELKAANEELQATNEELRSATEELETGKEELQSVNEELSTVNTELKDKVDELSHANSDLFNLIASTRIVTLFVDRGMCIKMYTPSALDIFNIIPTDIGRPLAHITHNLVFKDLVPEAEQVLRDLQTSEREVATESGHWYILRMNPYRGTGDKITGVVITLTDIDELKKAETELGSREGRLRLLVESSEDYAFLTLNTDGKITSWNAAAEHIFGYSAAEAVGQHIGLIFTPEDNAAEVAEQEMRTAERKGRASDERWHVRKDGQRIYVSSVMVPLNDAAGHGFAKIARNLTTELNLKTELVDNRKELEQRVNERTEELASANLALRREAAERINAERKRIDLVRRVVHTQEEERRRIARELHDQLGQSLTALRLKIEQVKNSNSEHAQLQEGLNDLLQIATRLDVDVDFLAWELRPAVLDDLGLVTALANYVKDWSGHFKIQANFHAASLGRRLNSLLETNLYRIAQEALNNVAKHAEATNVNVLLEGRGEEVVLIVEDDGTG